MVVDRVPTPTAYPPNVTVSSRDLDRIAGELERSDHGWDRRALDVRLYDAEIGQQGAQRALERIEVVARARDVEVAAVDLQADREGADQRRLEGRQVVQEPGEHLGEPDTTRQAPSHGGSGRNRGIIAGADLDGRDIAGAVAPRRGGVHRVAPRLHPEAYTHWPSG